MLSSEFNCLGRYSNDKDRRCPELRHLDRHDENAALVGGFKVPSLRTAAATPPYMHDGRYRTLLDVMNHYRDPPPRGGPVEFRPLFDFSPQHMEALAAFVASLGSPVDAPAGLLRAPGSRLVEEDRGAVGEVAESAGR